MIFFKRKFVLIPSFFLIIISSYLILKDKIIRRENDFINNIYFELPFLISNKKECNNIELLLKKHFDNSYSATIIDSDGLIIGTLNEEVLRLPASNVKLLSTAYVIHNVEPSDNLQTSLYKDRSNSYYIVGSGDPDLSWKDIKSLLNNLNVKNDIKLNLVEVKDNNYWPDGWTLSDKSLPYGAPISMLALNSNQNINKDINFLKKKIEEYLIETFPYQNIEVSIINNENFTTNYMNLIASIPSNSFLSLITLANSISHNFTAEILYKNVSNSWVNNNYSLLEKWLIKKGLPFLNSNLSDASGLSRHNRINTNLMALFLYKMQYSDKFDLFNSSLSIIGLRGTLSDKLNESKLSGLFFGKTGTLSNAFALSGYLYKNDKPLIISIIQNSKNIDRNNVFNFLIDLYEFESCS